MPDSRGRLSETEKTEIATKIYAVWTGSAKNCQICGSNKWFVADHVVELPIINEGTRGFGGGAYPSVLLISDPCGFTLSFNAVSLGVIKKHGG